MCQVASVDPCDAQTPRKRGSQPREAWLGGPLGMAGRAGAPWGAGIVHAKNQSSTRTAQAACLGQQMDHRSRAVQRRCPCYCLPIRVSPGPCLARLCESTIKTQIDVASSLVPSSLRPLVSGKRNLKFDSCLRRRLNLEPITISRYLYLGRYLLLYLTSSTLFFTKVFYNSSLRE